MNRLADKFKFRRMVDTRSKRRVLVFVDDTCTTVYEERRFNDLYSTDMGDPGGPKLLQIFGHMAWVAHVRTETFIDNVGEVKFKSLDRKTEHIGEVINESKRITKTGRMGMYCDIRLSDGHVCKNVPQEELSYLEDY